MSEPQFLLEKLGGGSELEIKSELSVGRAPESDLKLTQGNPSRHHARLIRADEGLYVEDLKSTNGTYVNGTRIEQRTRLFAKDKIRFDVEEYVLRIEVPPPAQVDAAPMRPHSPAVALLRIYDDAQPRAVQLLSAAPSKREWSIGSDEAREIRIQREGVSSLHAKIVNAGKVWKVVDQTAASGTFVNGERVNMRYLSNGDRIDFGPVKSVFEAPGLTLSNRLSADSIPPTGEDNPQASAARRKRGLLIAGLFLLTTLIVLLIVIEYL